MPKTPSRTTTGPPPTREAYLTVIDPITGAKLWTASHVWGGVLNGVNSVGARLVKELEKQTTK